jgi:tol-pal system protein YbgF
MAGPAMTPPPAAVESQPDGPAPSEQGPTGLQPLPYWDDEKTGDGKKAPAAAKFEPRKPELARPEPPRSAAATAPARSITQPGDASRAPAAAQANGSRPAGMPPLPGMGGAERKTALAESPRPASAPGVPIAPVPVAMAAPEEKPAVFKDPDLEPPANPRALASHPEAKPLYDKGFVYLAKGDYETSIRLYQDFLKQFPDDNHSDNAQFWIGEAELQMKQMDKAEAAYREVLRNYAHKSTLEGYKTPDAIYKLGQISLLRNQSSRAEYYFRNVSERFPDSTAAQKAQRELESIRVNTAAGGEKPSPDS